MSSLICLTRSEARVSVIKKLKARVSVIRETELLVEDWGIGGSCLALSRWLIFDLHSIFVEPIDGFALINLKLKLIPRLILRTCHSMLWYHQAGTCILKWTLAEANHERQKPTTFTASYLWESSLINRSCQSRNSKLFTTCTIVHSGADSRPLKCQSPPGCPSCLLTNSQARGKQKAWTTGGTGGTFCCAIASNRAAQLG